MLRKLQYFCVVESIPPMEKPEYITPIIKCLELRLPRVICLSQYGDDPDGKGKDFEWGN